ncbi:MAG: DUF1211 domain-containing protein [Phycisphaerales bacterium]|nr:DUF1211 domain-containing protein [Phycisphaerales bacterium]
MTPLTDEHLERCPVVDGFRQRGVEMTRTETFVDASFAFAVTLLVISIDSIPRSYDELIVAVKDAPAFGLSFVMLLLVWYAHWGWSRRYGMEDRPTIALSGLLVFVVLCYIYPLKMLASGFVHTMTGGRLAANISITLSQLHVLFAVYGVGFVLICLTIVLLNLHAWRQRAALRLDALERFDTKAEIGAWSILGATGLLSVFVASVVPPTLFMWPGWIYATLPFVMPVYGMRVNRIRRGLRAPP